MALQILEKEKYGYLNFDDERLTGFTSEDFNKVLEAFYEFDSDLDYFIFDEIQNIKNWELFTNRLRRTKKIIVTGSNAHILSGELATHLTGRHINFTLYPFSFKEFLKFQKIEFQNKDFYSTKKISQIKKHLNNYIAVGGFPEAYKFGKAIVG
ncbi:MAG: AAA family ATPase, partial [Patescibacteria group bacterium]|nr:AAA family ATPase [Patescibacteria group bacterium]